MARSPNYSFDELNRQLMDTTDEKVVADLLANERAGAARPTYVARIHSRLQRLRRQRERRELGIS